MWYLRRMPRILRGSGINHRTIFTGELFAFQRLTDRTLKRVRDCVVVELAGDRTVGRPLGCLPGGLAFLTSIVREIRTLRSVGAGSGNRTGRPVPGVQFPGPTRR